MKINLRGVILEVERDLLTSVHESALEAMFSGRHELDEIPYIDRDPETFKLLLKYIESGK